MFARLLVTVLAVVAGVAPAARADVAPGELLQRANAARKRAEQNLARARHRHLDERKALAGKLQKAYSVLSAAQAKAVAARASLKRSKPGFAEAGRTDALTAHKIRTTVSQAAAAAEAKLDAKGPVEAMERAIWKGFEARLARLADDSRVTIRTKTVVGRDGRNAGVPVLRLGAYAAYACGDDRRTCGLLRSLAGGGLVVAGPFLDAAQARALRAAAAGKLAHLPVDVSGVMLDRTPAEPKTLQTWLAAGGMFIIPIIIVGALGLVLVIERVGYLVLTKAPPSLVKDVLSKLESGDLAAARHLLSGAKTPTARALLAGIDAAGKPDDQREAAMESALLAEAPRLERSLSLLGALAGVAPLLGLLGTVSGMIATFETISTAGTGNPRLLSGGISEALITTELGLIVAIPLLLAHAWLRRWAERREALLEYNAIQVFGIKGKQADESE